MSTNNLIEQRIVDTLEKNYMPYAMSVIVSRAIPEIDGLKPSTESCFIQCIKWVAHRRKNQVGKCGWPNHET